LIHVVILAGSSGTRFWPKSRGSLPKQFLSFGGREPLLVETAERMRLVAPPERTWVVTAEAHVKRVRKLLPGLPAEQVVGEPAARDTAPAVALAALRIARREPDATLLVCPADHRIEPAARLAAAIRAAEEVVTREPHRIVVFGIAPTEPSTGYGYVEFGAPLGTFQSLAAHDVKAFHEKPDAARAREYVAGGRHWWNAGIACLRATALREEIALQMPALAAGLAELEKCADERRFAAELARLFPTFEKRSLDHGVLERARARGVIRLDLSWDDVGSFPALARTRTPDANGNVVLGDAIALDASRNIVDAGDGLVALIGVDDVIVVHTGDVTLVCRRDRAEEIKRAIEQARARKLDRFL